MQTFLFHPRPSDRWRGQGGRGACRLPAERVPPSLHGGHVTVGAGERAGGGPRPLGPHPLRSGQRGCTEATVQVAARQQRPSEPGSEAAPPPTQASGGPLWGGSTRQPKGLGQQAVLCLPGRGGCQGARERVLLGPPSPRPCGPRGKSQKKVPNIQKMPFLVFISYFWL